MTKEEIKQYLRNQIDSCVKIQSQYNKHIFYLLYNKQYLRALKLSTITGQPVNKEKFKDCETLFRVNAYSKEIWSYPKINDYLIRNYSDVYSDRKKIIKEVINEYEEYKGYNAYKAW